MTEESKKSNYLLNESKKSSITDHKCNKGKKVASQSKFQLGFNNFSNSNKYTNNGSRNLMHNSGKFSSEDNAKHTVNSSSGFESRYQRIEDKYRKISKSPVDLFSKKYMTKQVFTKLTSDELGTKFTIIK